MQYGTNLHGLGLVHLPLQHFTPPPHVEMPTDSRVWGRRSCFSDRTDAPPRVQIRSHYISSSHTRLIRWLPHQRPHWTLACKEAAMARREGARQGSMMSPSLTALHRLLCASCCDGRVCDAACTCTTCSTCHAHQAVHDGQSAAATCQETQ